MTSRGPSLSPPSARQLGETEVHERLAVGDLAEVFRGTRAGADVLVKVLSPKHAGDARVVAQFEREAALGARLRHAGLVPVFEHGTTEGRPYLVCGRVEASPLTSLRAKGPLGEGAVLAVGRDLLATLAFIHDAKDETGQGLGLALGDLDASKVLVDRRGHALLLDLGVARAALRAERGEAADARADVQAVAELLAGLSAGRPLFAGERWERAEELLDALDALGDPELEAAGRAELGARVSALRAAPRSTRRDAGRGPRAEPDRAPRGVVVRRLLYFAVGIALSGLYVATRGGSRPPEAPSSSASASASESAAALATGAASEATPSSSASSPTSAPPDASAPAR